MYAVEDQTYKNIKHLLELESGLTIKKTNDTLKSIKQSLKKMNTIKENDSANVKEEVVKKIQSLSRNLIYIYLIFKLVR